MGCWLPQSYSSYRALDADFGPSGTLTYEAEKSQIDFFRPSDLGTVRPPTGI